MASQADVMPLRCAGTQHALAGMAMDIKAVNTDDDEEQDEEPVGGGGGTRKGATKASSR